MTSRDVQKEGFVLVFGHEAVERGDEPRKEDVSFRLSDTWEMCMKGDC